MCLLTAKKVFGGGGGGGGGFPTLHSAPLVWDLCYGVVTWFGLFSIIILYSDQ